MSNPLLPFIRRLCSQHNEFILLISQKVMSNSRSDLEEILELYIHGTFLAVFLFSAGGVNRCFKSDPTIHAEQSPVPRAGSPPTSDPHCGGAVVGGPQLQDGCERHLQAPLPQPHGAEGRFLSLHPRKPILVGSTFLSLGTTRPGLSTTGPQTCSDAPQWGPAPPGRTPRTHAGTSSW